ncbi:MAG TPA: hypothetical protein VGS22_28755 [Thermoanaerobaculia bacterium]|jgi:hypothetical protein|nr:hypothetical protein [Thermoanaerobaculia bacterium]
MTRIRPFIAIFALLMLVAASGAYAQGEEKRSGVRVQKFEDFLKDKNSSEEAIIQCNIYCDGLGGPPTQVTFPGTVAGCLADCEEICGSPCEVV